MPQARPKRGALWDAAVLIDDPIFLVLTYSSDGEDGEIVRLSATRSEREASGVEHLRVLERLCRPSRRLTLAQARACGMSNKELEEAPELEASLQDLLEFATGATAWIVAAGQVARAALASASANAGFARGFGAPVIGCDELGAVVLPTICRQGVADLMRHYGAQHTPTQATVANATGAPTSASAGPPDSRPASPLLSGINKPQHPKLEIKDRDDLSHRSQEAATYFVTYGLADSLPKHVLAQIEQECHVLIKKTSSVDECTSEEKRHLTQLTSERIEEYLDQGTGQCWLRNPDVAKCVVEAFHHFDADRYRLCAYCVMPNHVHVVLRPLPQHDLSDILQSWKSFTARAANKLLGESGTFWQRDYFDRRVRNEEHYRQLVKYILENPSKAKLKDWPWVWVADERFAFADRNVGVPVGLEVGAPAHGAVVPLQLRTLWAMLESDLLNLPLPVLAEMNWLLSKSTHPLRDLLKKAESHAVETQFTQTFSSGKLSIASLYKDHSEIIKKLQVVGDDEGDTSAFKPSVAIAAGEIEKLLGPQSPLARALPTYEHRHEQIEMARRVSEAFSHGKHLLAEAGTGVGKSIAYLVPAILFARRNGRPVVISTHTKNLQAQLFNKDIPLLRQSLGLEFKAALLKGRTNYLCLRKFMYTLQESAHELEDEERAALLPVLTWSAQTADGDVAELAAFSPERNPALWDRLHTVGEDCLARQCPFYQRCFVYKARGTAREADVVVSNHAQVFADLNKDNGSLPQYREIVFDEAHTLEDVATEHLACEVTPRRVYRILSKLFRAPQGASAGGKGLLPSLLFQLEMVRPEFPPALFDSIRAHVLAAIQAVDPASGGTDAFFDVLREWLDGFRAEAPDAGASVGHFVPRERGKQGSFAGPRSSGFGTTRQSSSRGEGQRRYAAGSLDANEQALFDQAKSCAIAGLGKLRQALEAVDEDFKEIRKRNVARARELNKELGAQNLFLQELIHDIEFVIKADEPNYVYWIERQGRKTLRLVAAPLDLSALLHGQLYDKRRAVVLTSATLSVRDAAAEGEGLLPVGQPARPKISRSPVSPTRQPKRMDESNADLAPLENLEEDRKTTHKKAFEFLKKRLGLSLCEEGRLDELLEGSPFDYASQCRLFLPVFLPSPESADYSVQLSATVAQLAIASQGRALVLYTSYAALSAGARFLRKALGPEGLEVLAQGEDGSREALLAKLKAGGRTVLLGTSSFWEGVDVPGDALSLLVIAKLPFQVFTDPIVEGRCEKLEREGKDPFLHFSVPNAILKLRQGFGRLIRGKNDRGVVVLCDKRVLTKRYGPAFLRALPAQAQHMPDVESLAEAVRDFLAPASIRAPKKDAPARPDTSE